MNTKRAFTLVEILTVIVIISILAALVTLAVAGAIRSAKRAKIGWEMSQIAMALELYKGEFGEYPPDMFDIDAVVSHAKSRWPLLDFSLLPGYPGGSVPLTRQQEALLIQRAITQTYQTYHPSVDFTQTNAPLAALALWLGGFPNSDGKLSGFGANPANPFDVTTGYDGKAFLDLELGGKRVRIYNPPNGGPPIPVIGNEIRDVFVPIVYFKGKSSGGPDAYNPLQQVVTDHQSGSLDDPQYDWCFPYADTVTRNAGGNITGGTWKNPTKYQLIHPGLDGKFGKRRTSQNTLPGALNAVRVISTGDNVDAQDLDNIMNFSDYKELKSILP